MACDEKLRTARALFRLVIGFSSLMLAFVHSERVHAARCTPTPWDEIGPFYRPNAPVRDRIGTGYELSGTVRSAKDCSPLPNARIEFWQAGPNGSYDEAHRATIHTDRKGHYHLKTDFPPPYAQRPPHIHILVDAKGFEGLITQHYPKRGLRKATFDLVLVPDPTGGGTGRNPLGK